MASDSTIAGDGDGTYDPGGDEIGPVPALGVTTRNLTEREEREVVFRYLFSTGEMPTQRQLAREYDTSQATISKIIARFRRLNQRGADLEESIITEFSNPGDF